MSDITGISFFVEGTPVPKQSYRHNGRGGRKKGYLEPRVLNWKTAVQWKAKEAIMNNPDFVRHTENVKVRLDFSLPDRIRRDLDNLSKNVLDALNGIIWEDDTQVVDLHITKEVDRDDPGVLVKVQG